MDFFVNWMLKKFFKKKTSRDHQRPWSISSIFIITSRSWQCDRHPFLPPLNIWMRWRRHPAGGCGPQLKEAIYAPSASHIIDVWHTGGCTRFIGWLGSRSLPHSADYLQEAERSHANFPSRGHHYFHEFNSELLINTFIRVRGRYSEVHRWTGKKSNTRRCVRVCRCVSGCQTDGVKKLTIATNRVDSWIFLFFVYSLSFQLFFFKVRAASSQRPIRWQRVGKYWNCHSRTISVLYNYDLLNHWIGSEFNPIWLRHPVVVRRGFVL